MKTYNIAILLLIFSANCILAQKTSVADRYFDQYAYIKAAELYEARLKKGDSSFHIISRLADCYYNNTNSDKAYPLYEKIVTDYPNADPEYIYKYIQTLRATKQYEKAGLWLANFNFMKENDSRIADLEFIDNEPILGEGEMTSVIINNLPINSKNSDFGAHLYKNTLYFSSTREKEKKSKKIYRWNNEPFLDIYQAKTKFEDDKQLYEAVELLNSNRINTDLHEANIAVSNDGRKLYFTRDNSDGRKKASFDGEGTSHLKIYRAEWKDSMWKNAKELSINNKKHSTGHPALNADNTKLFFVSDRKGGYGQTDIYYVDIYSNGTYGKPINLGPNINTEGRELFPFVGSDDILYFSSDGHKNLGFLDIFQSNILTDSIAKPLNLGKPFNSNKDDFAFFIDAENTLGYFSSNRDGGHGKDDIYEFYYETVITKCYQNVFGITRDEISNLPLVEVTVSAYNENGVLVNQTISDENGYYVLEVDCNSTYKIIGTKIDYRQDSKNLITDETISKDNELDLFLKPIIQGNKIVINPIYFDYGKWDIREDAEYELEIVATVLKDHPNMVIKIESHTDSRSSSRFNKYLSDKRAKSTRDYILSRGIESNRIESAIGYGESKLLNKCSNGIKCSEKQHQVNRRSYFIILKN